MTRTLRVLTERGCEAFRAWLVNARATGVAGPLPDLLDAEESSRPGPPGVALEAHLPAARWDAAEYLARVLAGHENWGGGIAYHQGLWSWVALHYFDDLCPEEGGRRHVLSPVLYAPLRITEEGAHRNYYRHLLAGPYSLYRLHGLRAKPLLVGPVRQHPDIAEQVASRLELIQNQTVMALVSRLYFDERTGRLRRGFSDRKRKGNLRRLIKVLQQLSLTYDLQSLTLDDLERLLPTEFAEFRPSSTS